MVQNVNLLEKKLSFSSKTTRQNKKNEYTTPPPEFFENKRVSALSLNKKTNKKTILKNNFRQGAGGFK